MRTAAWLVLSIFAFHGCGDDSEVRGSELEAIVKQELILFEPDRIPDELVANAREHRLLLLGETHYVQEHCDFLANMLGMLQAQGYRALALESVGHSVSYLVDDYVQGEAVTVPEDEMLLAGIPIQRAREINQGIDEQEARLHVYDIDINHSGQRFLDSIANVREILTGKDTTVFDALLATEVDTDAYENELNAIHASLVENRAPLTAEWGEQWYGRLLRMLSVEIESLPYRLVQAAGSTDWSIREEVYHSNIQSVIAAYPQGKIVVNGGLAHTRKNTFGVSPAFDTGERLAVDYGQDSYSIAFVPLMGTRRYAIDSEDVQIDVTTTDPDNLLRIIAELAGDKAALLPLEHPRFADDVKIDLQHPELPQLLLPLGEVYDAIVTYPHASVLESLASR